MSPTTYFPAYLLRGTGASLAAAATPTLPERVTRANSVLLFVDCQVGPLWDLEFGSMRRRMADLAGTARRAGVPTVISARDLENHGPVVPEMLAANPTARLVMRTSANAWNDDVVRAAVLETNRPVVIVIGAASDVSVVLCAMSVANDGLSAYAVLEAPGMPPENGRWFADRLIVTTCCLVSAWFEPGAVLSSRDCRPPTSTMRPTRISQERRALR